MEIDPTVELGTNDVLEEGKNIVAEFASSIPGIDEAMSFAELMKYVFFRSSIPRFIPFFAILCGVDHGDVSFHNNTCCQNRVALLHFDLTAIVSSPLFMPL